MAGAVPNVWQERCDVLRAAFWKKYCAATTESDYVRTVSADMPNTKSDNKAGDDILSVAGRLTCAASDRAAWRALIMHYRSHARFAADMVNSDTEVAHARCMWVGTVLNPFIDANYVRPIFGEHRALLLAEVARLEGKLLPIQRFAACNRGTVSACVYASIREGETQLAAVDRHTDAILSTKTVDRLTEADVATTPSSVGGVFSGGAERKLLAVLIPDK